VSATTETERLMFEFVDAYERAFEAAAKEHGLSPAHACVLGRLDSVRGMGELSDELGCDASNVTQIVARLEARELAVRQANPDDRRFRQIQRTTAGDAVYAAFEESFDFPRRAVANLTTKEQRQLATLLGKSLAVKERGA